LDNGDEMMTLVSFKEGSRVLELLDHKCELLENIAGWKMDPE